MVDRACLFSCGAQFLSIRLLPAAPTFPHSSCCPPRFPQPWTSSPCPPHNSGAQLPFPLLPCFAPSFLFRTRYPASRLPCIHPDGRQGLSQGLQQLAARIQRTSTTDPTTVNRPTHNAHKSHGRREPSARFVPVYLQGLEAKVSAGA